MDFDFSDEQVAVRDLAAQIFTGHATVDRIKQIEAGNERIDRDLWAALATANLLGIALPEEDGGSGLGLMSLCLVLQEQGRRLAPVPLLPTIALGALPIAEFGTVEQRSTWLPRVISGEAILTAALDEADSIDPAAPRVIASAGGRLSGSKVVVPAGHIADRVLVPASTPDGVTVFVVDPSADGVTIDVVDTTDHQRAAHITFVNAPTEATLGRAGDGAAVVRWILDRGLVGLAAIQLGVADEAIRLAAEYTSGRLQFGKPLSTFQGVSLRAADAYIDASAMNVTLWQAAWRIDEGLDASREVAIAKWWAADGGERVVHATQHLHGGMGADVDYPVHRYFLWGKQIADSLGGASKQLARIGADIADAYR
ncbi:MAG: acyl-CoA/acyl-ACP dehydrogenase [Actinobacteria bacterium]|nr:acyl-CoA/acyl-ACP dehydrogenase [Actinomycetota bacterium]